MGARPDGRLLVLPVDGRVPYGEGLEWQREAARRRIDGAADRDLLLLLEHEPVLTLGRNAAEDHLAVSEDRLRAEGVERIEVERGGDVTYHGPGQLVGYPILDLAGYRKDLHWYLRTLEEALLDALEALGLPAFRVDGYTGIWVRDAAARADGDGPGGAAEGLADRTLAGGEAAALIPDGTIRKIASIGVHVSRWVTWHGFALNLTPEPLEKFGLVVPCGIRGVRMTSLRSEGVDAGMDRVRSTVARSFGDAFGVDGELRPAVPWAAVRGGEAVESGAADSSPADGGAPLAGLGSSSSTAAR